VSAQREEGEQALGAQWQRDPLPVAHEVERVQQAQLDAGLACEGPGQRHAGAGGIPWLPQ
jgi:hypothetical protein